nr:uncharacterized protein LOC128704200 [Cherax quadricarinatus]
MLPFGHKDNDVKSLEHQRNNKLSSGYQRNDLSFGHQENDKIPSEHQNNMIPSREERSDLLPDKLPGSSQTIRDTGPRLSSAEVCPNLTRLLSPNNDPDLIPPSYDLECKMTPPGAMYTLTYIYETPGRYHLVAYYKERTSGTTLWRREVQVEVQVLQVVLGPSAVLTLLHGSVTAHAHLSLTPATAHSLCPRGHISWAWDFGEELAEKQREEMMFGKTGRKMGDGEITGEMTGDDERVENLRDEDELLKKGSGEYEDYVVLLEKVTEENRKQVERRRSRRDARFIHRREMAKTVKGKGSDILAEGKEQQVATSEALTTPSYLEDIVTGDNEASSAGGDNESSRAGSDEEDSSAGGDDEESNAVGDDEDSSSGGEEEGSSTDFHYGIPSATLPIVITTSNSDTVSSSNPSLSPTTAPSINCHTSTTTTTKPPLSHTATTTLSTFYSTITSTSSSASTIRDINTKSSPSTTVYHNYHQPGTYDFSAQVKCNSLGLFKKKIDNAFLVVLPIGDVEISSSRTVVVLEQVTEPVTVTVRVSEGSHLQPLTLDLADGTILHIPPKFLAENGNWVAQVEHVYSSEGDYLPRVHVVNPVSWRNTSIPRPIRVQHLPSSVFLWPENYLGAVGEVVTFHAHALGTDLHYDWLLPGGEHLHDSGRY